MTEYSDSAQPTDASTRFCGTIVFICQLPWPWPPTETISVCQKNTASEVLSISIDASARLNALVEGGGIKHVFSTGTITLDGPASSIFIIGWDNNGIKARINGSDILNGQPLSIRAIDKSNQNFDFGEENSQAIARRRSTMMGTHVSHGRSRATDDYIFSGLEKLCLRLDDGIEMAASGKTYHITTLAGLVRTAISDNRRSTSGLVQWCAAMLNAPLILYTNKNPRYTLSGIPLADYSHFANNGSSYLTTIFDNPIDLDIWLTLHAFSIAGKRFSNAEAIHKIASTIDVHFDIDSHPLIEIPSEFFVDKPGFKIDMLQQYILNVAEITRVFCKQLIDLHLQHVANRPR